LFPSYFLIFLSMPAAAVAPCLLLVLLTAVTISSAAAAAAAAGGSSSNVVAVHLTSVSPGSQLENYAKNMVKKKNYHLEKFPF